MDENNEINKMINRDLNFIKQKYVKKVNWEEENNEIKKEKIHFPKRKYAIIHGYFGHDFKGNQKYFHFYKRNTSVRTVEEEIEKVLYKLNYISECNYGKSIINIGVLQKIGWSRASRTDKKVSAVFNMISCKLHKVETEEEMKTKINDELPTDIKIFSKFYNNKRNY